MRGEAGGGVGRGRGGAGPAVNLKPAAADWRAWWAPSQLTVFTNRRARLAKFTPNWPSVTLRHLGGRASGRLLGHGWRARVNCLDYASR